KHEDPDEVRLTGPIRQAHLHGAYPLISAIHRRKKEERYRDELSYIEADEEDDVIRGQEYISPLIEGFKLEILLRANKEQKRLADRRKREGREKARDDDPYNLKGKQPAPSRHEEEPAANEDTGTVQETPVEKTSRGTTSPYNVIMTPYDKKKRLDSRKIETKRQGPKYTMPSIHMLGSDLTADYGEADGTLSGQVIGAFEAIGIPAEIFDYKTNGIIGRFGIKLDRTFRLSNIARLREHLGPNLPFDSFRIIAPIIGTGNIGI